MQRARNRVLAAGWSRREFLRTVTVAAGAVLAGCGKSPSDGQPKDGRIRLVQWYHQYGEAHTHEAVLRYAKEYTQQNPHVEIKVVWIPGNYAAKLTTGLISGRGPDVFEAQLGNLLGPIAAGQVLPLDDLLTEADRQDFAPAGLAMNSLGGKLYGIPQIIDACLLYYRRSALRAAGLEPPTTMDALIAAARALTGKRTKGLFVGNDGGITALVNNAPWSAGADFLVDGRIVFDTPGTAAAFGKVKELYDSRSLLVGAPTDWWVPAALTEELAAMQWCGFWALKETIETLGDDVGVAPWPALTNAPPAAPVVPLSSWAAFVNANGPHVEEAKQFVRWLWVENRQVQTEWNVGFGTHIPPRQSLAADAPPLASGSARDAVELAGRHQRLLAPAWNSAMQTALLGALARFVRGQGSAADEIRRAAAACAAELDPGTTH